jgi:ElaB/YqjD/DUF883 family membrane-anchored ribosome-binding protein
MGTSEMNSTVEQASSGAHQAIDTASNAAGPVVDGIAAGAHQVVDKLAGTATRVADSLDLRGDQLQVAQSQLIETCRGHLREHPIASLGVAVAVGYALSWLLRQR